MELRDFLNIFYKARLLYLGIIGAFLLLGALFLAYQPKEYQSSLLITIGRTEGVTASEYSYDGFYRLQADERFADTLVKLLGTSRVAEDIFADAKLPGSGKDKYFSAKRLSSQVVEVTYRSTDKQVLTSLGESIPRVLTRYTDELNREAIPNENWFRIVAALPVIEGARVAASIVLGVALFFGVFVGFGVILFRYYLGKS